MRGRAGAGRRRRGHLLVAALLLAGPATAAGCAKEEPAAAGKGTTTVTTADEVPGTTEVPPDQGTQLSVYNPSVGDCFDRRKSTDGSNRGYILKLDCDKPHSFEVFALVDIPDTTFPGDAALTTLAKRQCLKSWTAYVGQPYETSELEYSYEAPSRTNWGLTYKHTLACLVRARADGGKLTGTARDSRL